MADEFEDYIFENRRETTHDFALANGDVMSVLRGVRTNNAVLAPFRKRSSYVWNSGASKRTRFGADGISVAGLQAGTARAVAPGRNNTFSVPEITVSGEKLPSSGGIPVFSSAARNASNGVDLTVKERQTPVFSGLFANHDNNKSGNGGTAKNVAGKPAAAFAVPSDAVADRILTVGNDVIVPGEVRNEAGGGTSSAGGSSKRPVQRNLTLSADDMANCRTYQVGYDIERESGSGCGSVSVVHNDKANNYYLSSDGGGYSISAPATGCRPYPGGDVIVIDDPIGYIGGGWGWIGIPERPIGGWIGIPERPIGGWIDIPYDPMPIQEYDVFEEYGIDLTSEWTEYTDSDFSKIDLAYGSKLSFSVSATNASTFTIYQCIQDENGGCTLKALQTTALTCDRESGNYVATTQALLLEAGQYCLYVQSATPAQEGDPAASYRFELNREDSDMFVDADNSDDWTDLATEGEFGEVAYAGTLDEYSYDLLSDWVGFGDAVDYAGFTLDSAARLSFSLDSTDAAKFTLYKLVQDRNGTYSLKALQTTSLSFDKEFEDYEATTKALLLEAGEYYVSMQSTNAAQGGSAWYNIYLNEEDDATVFFTEGDNSDDWIDLKTEGSLGQVRDIGVVDENSFDISSDWVGYGDEIDYGKFTLNNAAKLSFSIDADSVVKFTLYKLVQDRNGTYSLKALQTTSLSYDKEFEEYLANTKSLLLEAGEYYFSVQSPDAAQGGSAWYNVYLNEEDDASDFFLDGNNADDWTDLVSEGGSGAVDDIGVLNESVFDVRSDWVGFGDEVDYVRFSLETGAKLSFSVSADDAVKFTIYQLVQDKNGTYSLKTLQSTALSYDKEFEFYEATTKALLLEAGEYYFSVQSTSAAQGGSAWYDIYLNQDENGSEFYADGNNADDWTDLKTEGAYGSVAYLGYVDEYSFDLMSDWVGFGDTVDYAGFTLDTSAKLSFSVSADGAVKFTIYQLVQDKNGTYSLKALQTTALSYNREYEDYEATTKSLYLEGGDYYIAVQASNPGQGGGAWYNVLLNSEDSRFYTAGDSSDNWSDLESLGPDGSVGDFGVVDEYSTELGCGQVCGRESDFARISLYSGANVSFTIHADDASKFTIYRLVQNKNGKYSLEELQTTSVTFDRQSQEYEATTKALLLEAGDYYVSMQSANAQGVEYTVSLNGDGSTFYTDGCSWDDWTDLKVLGACGEVGNVGTLDESSGDLMSDWVGFGDEIDYAGFTLDSAASLRFTLTATDAVTLTIYTLSETKSGMFALTPLQTTALSLNKSLGQYEAVTKALLLEAGEYYFSVQSANAAQGGSAYYNLSCNPSDCAFYTQGWNGDDWTDLKTEGEFGSVGYIGVIDEYSEELVSDWVGFGDAVDYMGFSIFSAAKLSFSIHADDAVTFTVYQLVQDKKGAYSLKALQTTSVTLDKMSQTYDAVTKDLLLEAGDYYFSVQSVNAPQGGGANYTVSFVGGADSFYTEGDNSDDWTMLATDGESGDVGDIGVVDEYSSELTAGWVGFGDAVDHMRFTLASAANLSFLLDATDAATFTISRLVETPNGCTLKVLQTTALAFNRQMQDYEAATKALLLEAGDYYVSVQSANAGQGGSAYYNLNLNGDACTFYTEADNYDDWTDVKTEGPYGEVGGIGVVDEYSYELTSGWVGFGDEIDYAGFTLYDKANLSFSLDATDAATFTVYSLIEAKNGTYKLKTLQTTALSFDKQSRKYVADTKALLLEAGDYYFSVQSANAGQGGSAWYNLNLNGAGSEFFHEENDDENWGAIEYQPECEMPRCGGDTGEPVEWTLICGYPPCDEPVAMAPVEGASGDVLAGVDAVASVSDCADPAASARDDNKQVNALKELSSLA